MDYRDNRQRWAESHQVVHFYAGQWCTFTPALTIRAIVSGDTDPEALARYRDVRCKASLETIREALVGNYQREHVFALSQALALYDFYQIQVTECDEESERTLEQLRADSPTPEGPLPPARVKKGHCANGLHFDVREALYALVGVDLTQTVWGRTSR